MIACNFTHSSPSLRTPWKKFLASSTRACSLLPAHRRALSSQSILNSLETFPLSLITPSEKSIIVGMTIAELEGTCLALMAKIVCLPPNPKLTSFKVEVGLVHSVIRIQRLRLQVGKRLIIAIHNIYPPAFIIQKCVNWKISSPRKRNSILVPLLEF